MPKVIHIVVTEADIEHGVRLSPLSCPISRAVKRATRKELAKETVALISATYCYILEAPQWDTEKHFTLPNEAIDFITRFDAKSNVEPFEFDILLGDPTIEAPNYYALEAVKEADAKSG